MGIPLNAGQCLVARANKLEALLHGVHLRGVPLLLVHGGPWPEEHSEREQSGQPEGSAGRAGAGLPDADEAPLGLQSGGLVPLAVCRCTRGPPPTAQAPPTRPMRVSTRRTSRIVVTEASMSIVDLTADSLQELVAVSLDLHASLPPGAYLWYRGLGCASFELLPKIVRDKKTPDQVYEREARLLTRFRQRSMAYWPSGYPQNEWEHLFAMQHYGLPTRLLDWSENLFIAAYFALAATGEHGHQVGSCVPVIWCIDPVRWNRTAPALSEFGDSIGVLTTADEDLRGYSPLAKDTQRRGKFPVAMYGSHNSDRIVAQRGTFMVWGADVRSLEDFAKSQSNATLWRITLKGNPVQLAAHLQALGFSETMIFPELPSLATELTRIEGWRK